MCLSWITPSLLWAERAFYSIVAYRPGLMSRTFSAFGSSPFATACTGNIAAGIHECARTQQQRFSTLVSTMPTFLSSLVSSFYPSSATPAAEDAATSSNSDDEKEQLSISRLVTYPIKSCAGTEYQTSDFTIAGLSYDRRWMVVEEESKKMMTARTCPKVRLH